jgi:hypothetical protein
MFVKAGKIKKYQIQELLKKMPALPPVPNGTFGRGTLNTKHLGLFVLVF